MKEPLKVGDRVRVYGHIASAGKQIVGIVIEKPVDCSEKFKGDDYILVQDEKKYDQGYYCHTKQCRRLVKKERRRVWVVAVGESPTYGVWATREEAMRNHPLSPGERLVEFVEVRRGG